MIFDDDHKVKIETLTPEGARKLAEAHWAWLESLLHKIYVDSMVHGIKHGKEDARHKGDV